MGEKKTYKTLFVLEPSRAARKRDLQRDDVAWATLDLRDSVVDTLLTLDGAKGFFFLEWAEDATRPTPLPGHTRVRIHELLVTALRWQETCRFEISLCPWSDFVEIALGEQRGLEKICQTFDLVFGGADLMLDLSDPVYKLQGKANAYLDSLRWLAGHICVWPPPNEVIAASRKYEVIRDLDFIARTVTRSCRPQTRLLGQCTPLNRDPRYVFKREGSDTSNHREWGTDVSASRCRKMAADPGQYRWMCQDIVPYLRDLGEIRVYIIGGTYHSFIVTAWNEAEGGWDTESSGRLASLEHMSRMAGAGHRTNDVFFCNVPSAVEEELGLRQLKTFVYDTYKALCRVEGRRLNASSLSLHQIARLDIGVMRGTTGRLDYFVNEVERGSLVSLFLGSDRDRGMDIISAWGRAMEAHLDLCQTSLPGQ
ncbi:hypothetical protein BOTBODRAFT_182182 [Botryobasidium botryosum FD-172 SS1]|uniref:Uncharacterized protein n=1 Tax=Botryobasidium botryosum (strain FD-172 SS1) TaxID=930990 RepID=A0A067LUF1_BOTB1|nr:hypothetical protein BOTBODRAFT_182182 [Botryobasidium botryosum FD-172 SS1]